MGWLTDIGVSRLFGQQGTTGGAPRPGCAEAVGSRPRAMGGRSLSPVGHWRRRPPLGPLIWS